MATRFEIISQTVVRSIALENHFDALREGFHKPIVAYLPLVTAHSCACLLIRTCCNTTRCGLRREHGTTCLVLHPQTSFVSLVALSPTSNAPDHTRVTSTGLGIGIDPDTDYLDSIASRSDKVLVCDE